MTANRLYRDMIRDPRLWNLYLGLNADSIDVMAYCPLEDHSLFTATVPVDADAPSRVKAIEESVYDNPLLLNDFNRVTILSRTVNRALMPEYVMDNDPVRARDIATELAGEISGSHFIIDRLPLLDTVMCHFMEGDVYNFLNRTFPNARYIHRLSSLVRFFHGTNRGAGSMVTYVNLRRNTFDIVMYSADRLLLANTYEWNEADDVLYYIMAVRQAFAVDKDAAVVMSGDRAVREELTPRIREFIPSVIPAIFPAAMFRAGGQTAMNTPTDIVVLPLCE